MQKELERTPVALSTSMQGNLTPTDSTPSNPNPNKRLKSKPSDTVSPWRLVKQGATVTKTGPKPKGSTVYH